MTDSDLTWVPRDGALSVENWRVASQGAPAKDAFEYPLFSDAEIDGEITDGLGPYLLLNALGGATHDSRSPAAFLRVDNHLDYQLLETTETYNARYHGGYLQDEVAALLSLSLGIRLKAGGATRHFQVDGDPRGRPWSFKMPGEEDPQFIPATMGPILPQCVGRHPVKLLEPLARCAELDQAASVAVIRAARMYQSGVWVAESDPAQAWILLVSAIEIAAGHWQPLPKSWTARLAQGEPELVKELERCGGRALLKKVAGLHPYEGSTRRFTNFLTKFLPQPPPLRPAEWAQHEWSHTAMEESLGRIYDHRSRALHDGVPFPAPVGWAPRVHGDGYSETPAFGGGTAGAKGGVWIAKDIPMLLHVFEYITRNALVAWWSSMLDGELTTDNAAAS
ncbi:MAG TPA: hypothetical protein VEW03_12150 [Longimicrobiaceae bacterium]|nr:hypothetical protein [Longimicrobiaceae bacterium]